MIRELANDAKVNSRYGFEPLFCKGLCLCTCLCCCCSMEGFPEKTKRW